LNDKTDAPPTHKPIYAVLFEQQAEDAGTPVCVVPTVNRTDLVPGYLKPVPGSPDSNMKPIFALPLCSPDQQSVISALATAPNSTDQAALLPVGLGALCAINFVASTAIVVAANVSANRMLSANASGFALGAGTGYAVAKGVDFASKVGLGGVGFLCSGAGVYVGYMLVPAR
jgi:hypothetical protein